MRRLPLLVIGLVACGEQPEPSVDPQTANRGQAEHSEIATSPGPSEAAPAPEPRGDRGVEGAIMVARSYFDLVEAGRYGEAWRLWSEGGRACGMDQRAFAGGFARYREYRAELGTPGRIEGAAGTLYVDIPLRIRGHLTGGQPVAERGSVTLRRANDVPGSSEQQRQWRIAAIRLDAQSVP